MSIVSRSFLASAGERTYASGADSRAAPQGVRPARATVRLSCANGPLVRRATRGVRPLQPVQMPFEARDRASLRLVFSEAVSAGYRTLRDQAITATNGAVRQAQRIGGSSAEWNVTVEPSSREAVTVSVSGGTDTRGQGDSVCTDDGRRLSNSPSVTVGGAERTPDRRARQRASDA